MKLRVLPFKATLDGQVMAESSDKCGPWRREWQTTSLFMPQEPHEQYEEKDLASLHNLGSPHLWTEVCKLGVLVWF